MEFDVSTFGKLVPIALITVAHLAVSTLLWSTPAEAGKVYWKENPLDPGCFALAFADTNQWFATAKGYAFKKGVCHGQEIKFTVELDAGGESWTAMGLNFCTYHVGNVHDISATCHAMKGR